MIGQTLKPSYAPFGSVSPKNKKKQKKVVAPGPGDYQISLPIIEPVVQTIRKKNNNVIVKLGHIGTSSFQGNEDRFKEDKNKPKVGPGQYSPQSRNNQQKNKSFPRSNAASRLKDLFQLAHYENSQLPQIKDYRRTPTIPILRTLQLQQYMEMPKKKSESKHKVKPSYEKNKGYAWSKMASGRQSEPLNQGYNLGPGQYDLDSKNKNVQSNILPSSAFNSESVRSFFDKIVFETNKDAKARKRQQMHYKSDRVGPGSYEINSPKTKQISKYQFFGSTSERM